MTGGRFADCRSSRPRFAKDRRMFASDEGGESVDRLSECHQLLKPQQPEAISYHEK